SARPMVCAIHRRRGERALEDLDERIQGFRPLARRNGRGARQGGTCANVYRWQPRVGGGGVHPRRGWADRVAVGVFNISLVYAFVRTGFAITSSVAVLRSSRAVGVVAIQAVADLLSAVMIVAYVDLNLRTK